MVSVDVKPNVSSIWLIEVQTSLEPTHTRHVSARKAPASPLKMLPLTCWVVAAWCFQTSLAIAGPSVFVAGRNVVGVSGGGGFFLPCEDFGCTFDHSFPACASFK